MIVVFRADAGVLQGSGHVMRCLTLARELLARGHAVHFVTAPAGIGWLDDAIAASGVEVHAAVADELGADTLLGLSPDWVVVDSYRIDAGDISALGSAVATLAVVDGDARGIRVSLYLDNNLGAENDHLDLPGELLGGSAYALVRPAITAERREAPWLLAGTPRVVAFMGGTDPAGLIVDVARALVRVQTECVVTVIAPDAHRAAVGGVLGSGGRVVAPTQELPAILGKADVVVSAAGTSAWDLATLGIPAVLVGIVDNQELSLRRIAEAGLAETIDVFAGGVAALDALPGLVDTLLADGQERERLSRAGMALFDGRGPQRIADALEARVRVLL